MLSIAVLFEPSVALEISDILGELIKYGYMPKIIHTADEVNCDVLVIPPMKGFNVYHNEFRYKWNFYNTNIKKSSIVLDYILDNFSREFKCHTIFMGDTSINAYIHLLNGKRGHDLDYIGIKKDDRVAYFPNDPVYGDAFVGKFDVYGVIGCLTKFRVELLQLLPKPEEFDPEAYLLKIPIK